MQSERRSVAKNFRTTQSIADDMKKLLNSSDYTGYSEGDLINLAIENLISTNKIHNSNTKGGKTMKPDLQYEINDEVIVVQASHLIEKISRVVKAVDLAYAVDKPLYIMHPEIFRLKSGDETFRLLMNYAINRDIRIGLDGIEPKSDKEHDKFIRNAIKNKLTYPGWQGEILEKQKDRLKKSKNK